MPEPTTATTSVATTRDHLDPARAVLDDAERLPPSVVEPACCDAGAQHRQLGELLPDVYLVTDTNGVIREANAAVSTLFHGARTYILGKPVHAFVHGEERTSLATRLAKLDNVTAARPAIWQGRFRARRRGEVLRVAARISPLVDAGGAVTGVQWLLRDVTAELATAERLQALERELERRVQRRTAELDAIVRVQAAQLAAARPHA